MGPQPQTVSKADALAEAYKRGLLPPEKKAAYEEAQRRGLLKSAGPSLRSETDAIIEEAAAAIPGGFAAFDAKPADPQRMAAMGYVQDPLAKSGYARPQAQQARMADTGNTNSLIADVARGLEAPVRGLTGGGLEGWARTTQADPLRGAVEAVDFISPVDDLGRAYQGAKQAGAGLIEGDMGKAAQGAQQASIDGSFAALQMLPGSMTLRGMTGPRNALAPTTLAGAERAAVQATRAPPVGKPLPQAAAPQPQPAPFSAPAEPKASGFLRNNADRIVGGGVGAFAGSAGDAFAASGGDGNGGPDIINPYTGAAAGMFLPRAFARGYRAAGSAIRGGGFDEAVAVRRVRNLLAPAGRSADEIAAADTAQFGGAEGGKPSVLADLTQNAQNFSVNLSRQSGVAPELASQQSADLARTRTGRLFSDVETTTNITPATVTADLDAAIKQASEEISPAYEALFGKYAGVNSERLMQLADDPVVGKYVRAAIKEAESLQTTAGQAPSNARTWDLVKRALDRPIDKAFSGGSRPSEALLRAREAVVRELDELMPEYAAVREGADAPRMKGARKEGAKVAGGGLSVEKVRAIASKLTGKPLTALQMGAVEKIVLDIEKARGIDGLSSERMREVLGAVFGQDAADQLTARIRADQTILKNAQRRDPDLGSATSQAGMADRGLGEMAADAFRTVRNPLEAALAMMSRSGAYTQAQRNRIAEMLYGGATDENLARIYGNRPPRNALNVEPPPTPQGPPTNALAPRRPEQAGFGGKSLPMDEATGKLAQAFDQDIVFDDLLDQLAKDKSIDKAGWLSIYKNLFGSTDGVVGSRADIIDNVRRSRVIDVRHRKARVVLSGSEFQPYRLPTSKSGVSGNPEAIGAAGGTAIGMATAPDQNGDGVVDAQERMMGGAGGALTGGIAGRGVRGGMNALAPKPGAPIVKPPTNWPPKPMADAPAPGKIRAYHGSKHDFDEFALTDETVGSGEGTQSRGYGLYFAERPNLANFYRSIGQNSGSPEDFAGSLLYHEGGDVEKVRAFLKGEIKKAGRTDPTQYKRSLDALNKGRATDMSQKQGAFYEVDLDAQGDDLFDLDAPLSGQTEIVQSRVADAWQKLKGDAPLDPQTSGYDILVAMGNDKAASEALSANGIKGAQFLDRASREAKSGTRNYVMFDPKNVAVRNKQSAKPN